MSFKSLADTIKNDFLNFYKALSSNVVDSLASTSTDLPLSANQGKVLNEKINRNLMPVGYIFTWTNSYTTSGDEAAINIKNPPDLTTADKVNEYFGYGEWVRIYNKFLYSGSDSDIGKTGGEATVTLTVSNMPKHSHSIPQLKGTAIEGDPKDKEGNYSGHQHTLKFYKDAVTSKTGTVATRVAAGEQYDGHSSGAVEISGAHKHPVFTNASTSGDGAGKGDAHNNMPPYVNVYMWMRVA